MASLIKSIKNYINKKKTQIIAKVQKTNQVDHSNNDNNDDNHSTINNIDNNDLTEINTNTFENNQNTSTSVSQKERDFREEFQILKVLFVGNCRKAIQSIQNSHRYALGSLADSFNSDDSNENKKSRRFTIRLNTNRVNTQKQLLQELYIKHSNELSLNEQRVWREEIDKMEEIANQIFLSEYQFNEDGVKLTPDCSSHSSFSDLADSTCLLVQSDMIDELDLSVGIQWFISKYSLTLSLNALNHFLLNHVGLLEEEIKRFIKPSRQRGRKALIMEKL
ncbi:hypothetical protein ABK040_008735 [Willaertia magna]